MPEIEAIRRERASDDHDAEMSAIVTITPPCLLALFDFLFYFF